MHLRVAHATCRDALGIRHAISHTLLTPGLHNKIPAYKIFARGWVAQEPFFHR